MVFDRLVFGAFFILNFCQTPYYLYDALFPYRVQVGMPDLSVGCCEGGGGGIAKESGHCSMMHTILPFVSWND